MKQIITVFLLVVMVLVVQCKGENSKGADEPSNSKVSEKTVQITGTIRNRDVYPNTQELQLKIPYVTGEAFKIVSPIKEDDTFYFEFELNQPQDVSMDPYLLFLYLTPGDSVHIELNFKDLVNVQLSGDAAAVEINHDFYRYFDQTFYRGNTFGVGTDCLKNCKTEEIRKQLEEKRDFYHEKRNAFLQKTKVKEEVVFLTEAMIELDFYTELIYTTLMRRHWGKDHIAPEILMDELNQKVVKYFRTKWFCNAHFNFMNKGYTNLASYGIQPPALNEKYTDWAAEMFGNDTIRNFVLAVKASSALIYKDLEGFEECYSQIEHEYLLYRLMKEYQVAWTKMNDPESVSGVITGRPKDMSASMLINDNLIAKTISKNHGKVQVIDIWATWCGPCISSLEQYKILIDEYAGKDVSFSFISVSGDEQRSMKLFLDKGFSNMRNYCCTNDEYGFLAKTFSPLSLPYGILINKKGVIVDHGTHVRPEMKLRDKINLLLEQDKLIK